MFRRKLHADADQKLRALPLIIRPNLSELHVTAWQCLASRLRPPQQPGSLAMFAAMRGASSRYLRYLEWLGKQSRASEV
jgi:hypothetical protein